MFNSLFVRTDMFTQAISRIVLFCFFFWHLHSRIKTNDTEFSDEHLPNLVESIDFLYILTLKFVCLSIQPMDCSTLIFFLIFSTENFCYMMLFLNLIYESHSIFIELYYQEKGYISSWKRYNKICIFGSIYFLVYFCILIHSIECLVSHTYPRIRKSQTISFIPILNWITFYGILSVTSMLGCNTFI